MATITATVVETGFANATKTYTLSDADLNRIVASYQQKANTAIGGTATRVQVLAWIFDNVLVKEMQLQVAQKETVPAVPGTPPVVT
jgi:hypothetical protein